MRVTIQLSPAAVTLDAVGSAGAYPLLAGVGSLHMAVRAGVGDTDAESPSVQFSVNNDGKRASRLLAEPLRKLATIYNDDGTEFYTGTIASIALGRLMTFTLES